MTREGSQAFALPCHGTCKAVITFAPVLMNEMNEALPAADYVIFAILVAVPAVPRSKDVVRWI